MKESRRQIAIQIAAGLAALAVFWWAGQRIFAASSHAVEAEQDVKIDIPGLASNLYLLTGSRFDQIQFPASGSVSATVPAGASVAFGSSADKALRVSPDGASATVELDGSSLENSGYVSNWRIVKDAAGSVALQAKVPESNRTYLVKSNGERYEYAKSRPDGILEISFQAGAGTFDLSLERKDEPGAPYWFIQMLNANRSSGLSGMEEGEGKEPSAVLSEELGIGIEDEAAKMIREICLSEAESLKQAEDRELSAGSWARRIFDRLAEKLKALTRQDTISVKEFISSGTASTRRLGEGERGGLVESFKNSFGRVPASAGDWSDVICSGSGVFPEQRDLGREKKAVGAFGRVYGRNPDFSSPSDTTAVKMFAYGARPLVRDLNKEKQGIKRFASAFKRLPASADDWDTVRGISYSGAK